MRKDAWKRISAFFVAVLTGFLMFTTTAQAITYQKDDTDLTKINIYQFAMTRDNMTVLSQGDAVKRIDIPAVSGEPNLGKASTTFVIHPIKDGTDKTFTNPLSLKFSNAGMINGKSVDVYVKVNSVTAKFSQPTANYNNPDKTGVPFITVDEIWGSKSFQVMDFFYAQHPNYTNELAGVYAIDCNITTELRYSDGTPCDFKLVMRPSDIDVIGNKINETFSLPNAESQIDRIVMNNRNALIETNEQGKLVWNPSRPTSGDDEEQNISGLAFRSKTNAVTFETTTAASSGAIFGVYAEIATPAPTKEGDPAEMPVKEGQTVTYTGTFTMPRPGIDTIGNLESMSMTDTFDERLDFQSLTVMREGQQLTEGTDYTVSKNGQKVTVAIDKRLLVKGNGGKKYTITYKTVTNSKIKTSTSDIKNNLQQTVDGTTMFSNEVVTKLLFEKTHEFVSGTFGKELPQDVLDLLPSKQSGMPSGTTVTPDQPLDGKLRVETSDGTWVFVGYDHDSETINYKNAHFVGTWVLEPQPKKDVLDTSGTRIDGKQVQPGQVLIYKISYTNTTNVARNVTITDTIPEKTSYIESSADMSGVYDQVSKLLRWNKSIAPGDTFTVTYAVKIADDAKDEDIVNTAHVSDGLIDVDTNPTKNRVTPKPPIPPTPNPSAPGNSGLSRALPKIAVPALGDITPTTALVLLGGAGILVALAALAIKKYQGHRSEK